MKCSSCNFENPAGVDYCVACNSPLKKNTNQNENFDNPQNPDNKAIEETAEIIDKDPAMKLSGECIGQVIDMRYIVTSPPSTDSLGRFCKGEDAGDDSPVLIRQIPQNICGNEKALAEIKSALDKLEKTENNNIITPLDIQLENPFKYFVLPDHPGSTLAEKLAETPLDVENAFEIFKQIAQALDNLHLCNMVHGNITPDNIIIDGKNALLANPCISGIIRDPEKYSAQANMINRMDDIYALGKCVYFALSGEYPEKEFSPLGVLSETQNAGLKKALSDEPFNRPATAKELIVQLGISDSELDWKTLRFCNLITFAHKGGKILLPPKNNIKCDKNAEISIKAECDENCHFAGWSGTAVDTGKVQNPQNPETSLLADDDYTLIADFAVDTHKIETSASEGGTVIIPANRENIEHGREILIHACADDNYHFVEWSGKAADDAKIIDPKDHITLVTVDEDISVRADFAKNCHKLNIESVNGGKAAKSEPDTTHEYGSIINISAQADENYQFVRWTGSAVDAGMVEDVKSERTAVTIEGEYTIAPVFELKKHQLNLSATEGGFVVKPDGESMTFEHGTAVEIKACPDKNYHFVKWTGSAADDSKIENIESDETKILIDGDMTLSAVFALDKYTVNLTSTTGGTARLESEENEYEHGTEIEITACADENYHFVKWTGPAADSGLISDVIAETTTLTVNADTSAEAVFALEKRKLTVTSSPGGSAVLPGEGEFYFDHGEEIKIQAHAERDHHFECWKGSESEQTNTGHQDENHDNEPPSASITITMDQDKTIHADFGENQVTIASLKASHEKEVEDLKSANMKKLYIAAAIIILLIVALLMTKAKLSSNEDSTSKLFDTPVKLADNSESLKKKLTEKA